MAAGDDAKEGRQVNGQGQCKENKVHPPDQSERGFGVGLDVCVLPPMQN
jgi:hypothetical protein